MWARCSRTRSPWCSMQTASKRSDYQSVLRAAALKKTFNQPGERTRKTTIEWNKKDYFYVSSHPRIQNTWNDTRQSGSESGSPHGWGLLVFICSAEDWVETLIEYKNVLFGVFMRLSSFVYCLCTAPLFTQYWFSGKRIRDVWWVRKRKQKDF